MTQLTHGHGRSMGILVLLIMLVYLASNGSFNQRLRLDLFDFYQRQAPRQIQSQPVKIIAIDEASLAQFGQWPWPRNLTARLIDKILAKQPAAVGLDMLMPEVDRLSPEHWLQATPGLSPAQQQSLLQLPSHDQLLAQSLAQGPTALAVAGAFAITTEAETTAPRSQVLIQGAEPLSHLINYSSSIRSIPLLDNATPGHGVISAEEDIDGVVRRIPLVTAIAGQVMPSMSTELLRLATGMPWFTINSDHSGINSIGLGEFNIATTRSGHIWLHYGPSDPRRFVSAADVLNDEVADEVLQGRLILIGVTALGWIDYPVTPLAKKMSGIEIHAQALEAIFDQNLLSRPQWSHWFELMVFIIGGGLLIYGLPKVKPLYTAIPFAALLLVYSTIAALAYQQLLLLDLLNSALALSFVFLTMLSLNLLEADQQRQTLRAELAVHEQQAAKLAGELEAARKIQMGILPANKLSHKNLFNLHAKLEPAKSVGGDFYDFFMLNDELLFFVVGDVSGKGIPASLFMALSKSLCKSVALRQQQLISQIINQANSEISRDNPEMMFVTLFAGLLNVHNGQLSLCNAGHDSPFLLRPGSPPQQLTGDGGPPLCMIDDFEYPAHQAQLQKGDTLCLFTDGITEALNPQLDLYSLDRLQQTLAVAAQTPEQLVEHIYQDVQDFAAGAEPADDITLVALQYHGGSVNVQ